jgi:hypothetical protein
MMLRVLQVRELMRNKLSPILDEFSRSVSEREPRLQCRVRFSDNESFVLRAYVASTNVKDGKEISITADAQLMNNSLIVDSDLCTDDGEVLISGPAIRQAVRDERDIERLLEGWCTEFSEFVDANLDRFIGAATK